MIACVVLLAFNLRPAVNALGVVLADVQDTTGLTGSTAGLLGALPTLCFAVMGFAVPALTRRLGARWTVVVALAALTGGQLLRAVGNVGALFAGSIIALAAITVGNVLLPGLIRQHFPTAIGPMTALYTTMLMIGQTLGAGITLPLMDAFDGTWQLGVGMWAATSAVALLPWLVTLTRGDRYRGRRRESRRAGAGATGEIPLWRLARSPRAWAIAVFFGMQSLQAYVIFAWVRTVLEEAGLSATAAGGMLAIITAVGIPVSALVPSLLGVIRQHSIVMVSFICALALGYIALIVAPATLPWLTALLIGFGLGSFPMALTLFALRAHTHQGTIALSGFGQSVGYLLASIGPVGFGYLHDLSGWSTVPLIAMLGTLVPMLIAGIVSVRNWRIEDDLASATPGDPAEDSGADGASS